ncbi:indole-3-glycerol phosphate synthase [Candidatus Uzinura diaspidicola str. ASNER]|uniref:indole-3-glycerol-phosphate synthase n=1 Tax=Candidatus Uzinura diaspidicola str. ASNER TaxID=1133592 RepID=L7VJC2_9FLAO|nr:indole-3-glycerol phosphate synthase [Candidatus Uzinura diaspidicola str. ASNER]
MNILEKIIEVKRKLLSIKRSQFPIDYLEKSRYFNRETYSLSRKISKKSIGIIAEFKRESPSKGLLNNYNLPVEKVIIGYKKAGVIGISILTDLTYFKGKEQDLIKTRKIVQLPLLYKDIIIDEYQVLLAKAIGSDIILLIAEVLSKKKIRTLIQTAKSLGLEVLMELHSERELYKMNEELIMIGVNNRDLRSFSINIESSIELSKRITEKFKISESGIYDPYQITFLHKKGFNSFLIGENFMRTEDPGKSCEHLIKKINDNQ